MMFYTVLSLIWRIWRSEASSLPLSFDVMPWAADHGTLSNVEMLWLDLLHWSITAVRWNLLSSWEQAILLQMFVYFEKNPAIFCVHVNKFTNTKVRSCDSPLENRCFCQQFLADWKLSNFCWRRPGFQCLKPPTFCRNVFVSTLPSPTWLWRTFWKIYLLHFWRNVCFTSGY